VVVWFIRENSAWHRTETTPRFGAAVVERTTAGEPVVIVPLGSAIAINGVPIVNSIHLLQHKDEISAADGTLIYFSTEGVPKVISFPGPTAKCGRCRTEILAGAAAVQCACEVWYHHTDPPCFEYGDKPACVACGRPTRLDGSSLWSPEALE
jgi:hypothetical protein